MDLFRARPEDILALVSLEDDPDMDALFRLYRAKYYGDAAGEVAAVESLFERLVLVEGRA